MYALWRRSTRWHNLNRIPRLLYASCNYSKVPAGEKSHVNSHHHPQEPSQNETSAPIGQKISTMVLDFIKSEGKHFIDNLESRDISEADAKEKDPLFEQLDPKIRLDLKNVLDDYNKLQTLLSYHPILINPELYLYYLNRIDVPLEDDVRNLVLRRLTFHRMFDECWSTIISSSPSLQDLEEYVEIIIEELRRNGDISFGWRAMIWALLSNPPSPNLKNSLLETICASVQLKKADMRRLSHLFDSYQIGAINFSHCSDEEKIFMITKIDPRSSNYEIIEQQIIDVTSPSNSRMRIGSGFVSAYVDYVKRNKLSIKYFEASARDASIIEVLRGRQDVFSLKDALCIIKDDTDYIFRKSYRNFRKKLIATKEEDMRAFSNLIFSTLILHPHFFEFVHAEITFLDPANIASALCVALKSNTQDFERIIAKISKDSTRFDLVRVAKVFVENAKVFTSTDVIRMIQALKSNENIHLSSSVVFGMIHKMKSSDFIHSKFWSSLSSLTELKLNRAVTLELLRFLLSKAPSQRQSIENLVQRLTSNFLFPDLKHSHNKSTEEKKRRRLFHNTVRAAGQSISLMKTEDIAMMLNLVFKVTSQETHAEVAKQYLIRNLISEVLRFTIKRADDERSAIEMIREIYLMIKFHDQTIYGTLVKLYVAAEPSLALLVLEFFATYKSYLSNDILRHVITGILSSKSLTDTQKIKTFSEFREKQSALGYKGSIPVSSFIELIDLILRIADKNQEFESIANRIIDQNTYKTRIPRKIQDRWRYKSSHLKSKSVSSEDCV
ncbi:hypothetical protein JA9_003147 [Meyerozyma sp. JA9]|nr:hypothetical protein JA9_003147 [Meyerozyma sp. JA9]